MANILSLHLHSPSSSSRFTTRRTHHSNYEITLRRSTVLCNASRSGRFRFRSEEEELFKAFGFGNNNKKKKPWWLDDDDDDDVMNDEDDDLSLVFRSLSWMLAPIGMSLLLGTDTNAGLMALAVPLLQSLFSLVFDKVLTRPSVRPMRRSSVRRRKVRQEENTDKEGGYKSWIVGDVVDDDNSMSSSYGGWDDLDTSNENVRSEQQFERRSSSSRRRWRVKEKPLLLRMLFAAFPFLSSWNKLLF